MLSSGFWLVAGGLVPIGALVGLFLWLDARDRRWSNRPWYMFVAAGVVVFVPSILIVVKVVAGGFTNVGAAGY